MIENNQTWLLEKFDNRSDLIGLTTYPWKKFGDPGEIPEDYYARAAAHTTSPFAFTEIGWISAESKGSSEAEQAGFLKRFTALINGTNVGMVNWLFLHEVKIEGIAGKISEPETSTVALKYANGTEKEVYSIWKELKNS